MFKNKKEQRKHWMNYARERLVGRKITAVDWLPEDKDEPRFKRPIILHLDDGVTSSRLRMMSSTTEAHCTGKAATVTTGSFQ